MNVVKQDPVGLPLPPSLRKRGEGCCMQIYPQGWKQEAAEVHAWHLSLWEVTEGRGWSLRGKGGVGLDGMREYEETGHVWGQCPAG